LRAIVVILVEKMSVLKYTIPNYNIGVAVEIKYTAPASGERVQFTLRKDDNNYMILVGVRYDTKEFLLNTKIDGRWGDPKRYNDKFNFSSNIPVVIRVEAAQGDVFIVSVNGEHLADFPFRYRRVTAVEEAGYQSDVKLESFLVQY